MKNKKIKRVAVFIDGSNFYYKLKSIGISNITYFKYGEFASWLAVDRKIANKRYYVGVVKAKENDEKGQKMRRGQRRLFNNLNSTKCGFIIERGYLMKNDGVFHEKGVDVKMAVDLLVGAYENIYDVAILVSSDTDLIPAIQKVKQLGKEVEYIGFSHKPSYGLIKSATESRLLTKNEIEQFQVLQEKKK
ncbi:MAG: protein of unknown function DUF88 [uncultured bacterium]|nr:MAG: protein of unknown function DUF88 [uncultured bacterium]KKP68372.1 MAG: hypothetical protein UR66_C0006G0073 [Candidatus Moranbacteria bacterium GW2011_GWE1_35_17]KKP82139.1 MAG: hypothetical protein UR82_C0043G0010 [Candidatus Moranbacteria bacterium GW2011_GWF1_35_5]HBR79249.1 hypothetical protein [Candidatus Moranbacteria bacterium]